MSDDQARPAAASPDTEYSLSIEEVAAVYESAGLPRDHRTIQRYCAKGKLVCHLIETAYGEKYLVTPASVATHIAYIKEVRQTTASRDEPRQVVASGGEETRTARDADGHATGRDEPRQTAANDEMMSRYVARLEGENEFLRGQVSTKDDQIKELTERSRETNHLIAGLQKMFTPFLGRGAASSPSRDDHGTGTE